VQDRPWRSTCLLSDPRYTPMDVGVRGCMRLGMRLARPSANHSEGSNRMKPYAGGTSVGFEGCAQQVDSSEHWIYSPVMQNTESSARDRALARFLRKLATAALDLADELESPSLASHGWLTLDGANLGSLQQKVAEEPGMDSDQGTSPREITQHLERGDEPNVRTALAAMQKRGVTEMVPGAIPQRWRLTAAYRRSPVVAATQDHDERGGV
jgi:hypothetical protein